MKEERRIVSEARLVKIETDIGYIKESQVKMDKKFDKLIDHLDSKFDHIEGRFERLPKKYANKYVEKVVWGAISLTLAAVFGAMIKTILV